MRDYYPLTEKVTEATGVGFRTATPEEARELSALGLPDSVLAFYRSFAPLEEITLGIIFFTIEGLLRENKEFGPAYIVCPHGYVSFADTACDDTYCFDLHSLNERGEPRIVLFSHEDVCEGDSHEMIVKYAKPVASDLYDFLTQVVDGTVIEDC